MIAGKVFQNLSRKTGIKAEALEKDYVMNLILDAIAHCPKTRDSFFFKGGCCVHKCFSAHMFTPKSKGVDDYFLSGRFSADVDLTVKPDMMEEGKLTAAFSEVRDYLVGRHGLEINQFSFPIYENNKMMIDGRPKRLCRGLIRFQGPMFNPKFNAPALKFDITADERNVFTPYKRLIYHPYAREEEELVLVALTYTLRDIFAEKVRALFERCSPRDVYDLNTLIRHPDLDPWRQVGIGLSLMEKFRLKNIPLQLTPEQLTVGMDGTPSAYERCRMNWKTTLGRQMSRLPAFETYWAHIPGIIRFADRCVQKTNDVIQTYCNRHHVSYAVAINRLMHAQHDGRAFQKVIDAQEQRFFKGECRRD